MPTTYFPTDGSEVATIRAAEEHIVTDVASVLRRDAPNLKIRTLVAPTSAVPLLEEVSESVDVLVVGHHRARWMERLISGSVSSSLSARARCPVVTVPYGNLAEHGPVVVALDVEAPATQVIELAFDRAQDTDRSVVVIHVVPDGAPTAQLEQLYAKTAAAIAPWSVRYPDCTVRIQLINGSPRHDLIEAVPQASLLVLTRPRAGTTLTRWIRSVSRAAQHRATCPIAMVDHS